MSPPYRNSFARGLCATALLLTLGAAAAQTAAPTQVRVAVARAVQTQAPLKLPARTAPAETALIFSRASGVIAERSVDLGDSVRRGDVLARISAPEMERAYTGALAGVSQVQAREQLARANLQRSESLVGQGYVSAAQLDALKAEVAVAAADVAAARAEAERLKEIVGFQRILAPIDGRIVERRIERGDRVSGDAAGAGEYLFRIARLDELRIEVDVPQAQSLHLQPGDAATLRFAELPGETLKATVKRKSGTIDAQTGTMRVELGLPNADFRLPGGLRGEVELTPSASTLVAIPMNALLNRNGTSMVAVQSDGRLRFRAVTVAHATDREVFIRSGLAAGEQVVQSPNALLRDGDAIVATVPAAS